MKLVSRLAVNKRYPNPLLFVHGICCGSWIWEWNYLPYFSSLGYDTHAINLTGHYLNQPPPDFDRLGTSDFLKDLDEVIAELPSPVVIGHSAGGFLLQKCLERHSLKGAILFASVGPNGLEREVLTRRAFLHLSTVLSNLISRKRWFLYFSPEAVRQTMFCRYSAITEPEVQRILSLVRNDSHRWVTELAFGLVKCHVPQNGSTPILVVAPQQDYFITPRQYEAMARRYSASIYRVERTGHAVQLESAWKQVAEIIHKWIQETVLPGK